VYDNLFIPYETKNHPPFTLWKKRVFCNWACNSIWITITIYNSLYFYTHECYENCMGYKKCNPIYIWFHFNATQYNLIATLSQTTHFQLLCNSPMTTTIMSWWCHFSSIHQNLTHDIMKIFGWFLKNIDIDYPLWLFILDDIRLWHVAQ